ATMFQGMVALPLSLALTAVTPGPPRPELPGMDAASALLASGQMLALPVVAVLVARGHPTWVPMIMSTVLAIHFAPYSWLYGTPLYLAAGAVVAIAVAVHTAKGLRRGPEGSEQ